MKLAITVIYVIFYNSILELIEVSAQQQRGCNSTADSPNPGKACIFPFTHNGQRYTGKFNFLKLEQQLYFSNQVAQFSEKLKQFIGPVIYTQKIWTE